MRFKNTFFFFLFSTVLLTNVNVIGQFTEILPTGINPLPSGNIPKLTYNQILALPTPQKGDLAIDLTYNYLRYYDGTKWVFFLTSNSDLTPSMNGQEFVTDDDAFGYLICKDNAGNLFLTGIYEKSITFGSFTLTNPTPTPSYRTFIVKFNPQMNVEWAISSGGINNFDEDTPKSIGTDVNGNVYVIGNFFNIMSLTGVSGPTFAVTSAGASDIFITKINSIGVVQWLKRAGSTHLNGDFPGDLAINSSGDVFITGDFRTSANFNTPSDFNSNTIVSAGANDVFFAKYSTDGVLQLLRRIGGTSNDTFGEIGLTTDGKIIISGTIALTANFNTPSASGSNELTVSGSSDVFIAKYDPVVNNWIWIKKIGGTGGESQSGFDVATFDNTVWFYARTTSTDLLLGGSIFPTDPESSLQSFFTKFDINGVSSKGFRVPGTIRDIKYGHVNGNQFIVIGGTANGTVNFNTPSKYGFNQLIDNFTPTTNGYGFVLKADISGGIHWIKGIREFSSFSGSSDIYSLIVENQNKVFYGGYKLGKIAIDNTILGSDFKFKPLIGTIEY